MDNLKHSMQTVVKNIVLFTWSVVRKRTKFSESMYRYYISVRSQTPLTKVGS